MSGNALIRPVGSMMWELRAAWATGRRVALSLDLNGWPRTEGHVKRVSATGAYVQVGRTQFPVDNILAVHHPSRLGDSTVGQREQWNRRGMWTEPQRERLWYGP